MWKVFLNFLTTHHTDSSIFFLLDKLIQKIYLLITTHESAHNLSSDTITVTFYQHGVTRVTDFQIIFTTFIAKHFCIYSHKHKSLSFGRFYTTRKWKLARMECEEKIWNSIVVRELWGDSSKEIAWKNALLASLYFVVEV